MLEINYKICQRCKREREEIRKFNKSFFAFSQIQFTTYYAGEKSIVHLYIVIYVEGCYNEFLISAVQVCVYGCNKF